MDLEVPTRLPDEQDGDARAGAHLSHSLDHLERARRVGVADDERRALHGDPAHEETERHVEDRVALGPQGGGEALGFSRSVADENQRACLIRAASVRAGQGIHRQVTLL
jgi:hypothetical protein